MRSLVIVAMLGCGGSSKPADTGPSSGGPKIDCVKLTDHILDVTHPQDREKLRADGIRTCPSVWHADHPSADDVKNVDCLMAAQTQAAIATCAGVSPPAAGSGSGTPAS